MKCEKHPHWDPKDNTCPYCREREGLRRNILHGELLDLITLMPDFQTQDIVDYINSLKEARRRTKKLNGKDVPDWTDEKNK